MNEIQWQLGAMFAVAMGLIEIIKALVKSKFGKNGVTKNLELIANNDLKHIYDEMKEQTNKQDKMVEILIEIKTLLKK